MKQKILVLILSFLLLISIFGLINEFQKFKELQKNKILLTQQTLSLVEYIGDFQDAYLIDKNEHLEVWYIFQDGDCYIITIHNGELDQKIQIN